MNVIVSMASRNDRLIYHNENCIYVNRMKPENRMILSLQHARNKNYQRCKYCRGLKGEIRNDSLLSSWEKQYNITIDYEKKTDILYVRTKIGCWKIFLEEEFDKYLLYHRNTYDDTMTFAQVIRGDYHRQGDVKPTSYLEQLIKYIVAHDKAKAIIQDDYRKLPKNTSRQRKYYRKAEKKYKRRERRRIELRMDELFKKIEDKDPSIAQLAFC